MFHTRGQNLNLFDSELNLALASLFFPPSLQYKGLLHCLHCLLPSSHIPHARFLRNSLYYVPKDPEMYIKVEEEMEHKAFAQLGTASCHDPCQFSSDELQSKLSIYHGLQLPSQCRAGTRQGELILCGPSFPCSRIPVCNKTGCELRILTTLCGILFYTKTNKTDFLDRL